MDQTDPLLDPTEEEKTAAMAKALRGQQLYASLLQVAADPSLSGLGHGLSESAGQGLQQLERGRERGLQLRLEQKKDAENRQYQQKQLDLQTKIANQDAWAPVTNTVTGETVMVNRKTGEKRSVIDRPTDVAGHSYTKGSGSGANEVTPETLDAWATQYRVTGQFPPLGMGKDAGSLRVKIANRALQLDPTVDLAGARAGNLADTKSLGKQTMQADAMNAFEQTALANLDTFLGQAKKVADVGSPLFNAPAREFENRVKGNPEMAAFVASRQTAVQEIGKVLSGSLGGQAISDSARHEVESLLSPDASIAQIEKAAGILKQDMANRKAAVDKQIQETRSRISGKSEHGQERKPVKYLISPDKKRRVPVFSDGSKGVEENNP